MRDESKSHTDNIALRNVSMHIINHTNKMIASVE